MNFETATAIECTVARYLNPRLNIIVPNVTWGLNLSWECDLAIATKSGYLNEVEIKVSMSDLKRDRNKWKWHNYDGNRIRCLWFAVPESIADCIEYIPARAGLLVVDKVGTVHKQKRALTDTQARKLRPDEILHLAHLGAMRIWDLKWAAMRNR